MVLTVPPNTLGGVEFATNDIFQNLEKVHKIKIRYLRNYGSQTTSGNLLVKIIKRIATFKNIFREIKRFKPDIIHIHTPGILGFSGIKLQEWNTDRYGTDCSKIRWNLGRKSRTY